MRHGPWPWKSHSSKHWKANLHYKGTRASIGLYTCCIVFYGWSVVYQGLHFSFLNLCHEFAWRPHNLIDKHVLEGEGQGLAAGMLPPLVFQG